MYAEAVVTSSENTSNLNSAEGALAVANSQLDREKQDVESAISGILEVQVRKISSSSLPLSSYNLLPNSDKLCR